MTPPGCSRDFRSAGSLDWDPSDTVGEFDIETRVASAPTGGAATTQDTCVSRAPDQETRIARTPAARKRLARGTRSDPDMQVEPAATVRAPAPRRPEKEQRVQSPPKRARRTGAGVMDEPTISLRGSRWSQQRPTTGVGFRPRQVRARMDAARREPDRARFASGSSVRARQARQTSPGTAPTALDLPVEILVLERMKLCPSKARITDVSRAAAFVACRLQPLPGRRLVLRVASDVGVGVAVGYVQETFEGAGFAVRVNASTEGFRAYVDALRVFADRRGSAEPVLIEPISMQIL